MSSTRIRLAQITFDAGTQIRTAIDPQVVTDYAEAMTDGAVFPPIVLFADGCSRADGTVIYTVADGFHRAMAAKRNGFVDIDADVRPGTSEDALWFALGANRTNGKRLSEADKRHAILIAVNAWPDRSMRQIAEQVGCSSTYASKVRAEVQPGLQPVERVVGADGVSYPASKEARLSTRERATQLLREGKSVADVRAAVGIGRDAAIQIQRELTGAVDKTRAGTQQRRDRMRTMATEGYSSRQIAESVGVGEDNVRGTLRTLGIDVPADRAIGKTHRHDSNRIVDQIVMDAANLTEGVNLIDFASLDPERLGEWADSLTASCKSINGFIKRLLKEQQNHGEAA